MKRRSRKALRLRAYRAVDRWAKPDRQLDAEALHLRRAMHWLDGYDAARRDMREERKQPPIVKSDMGYPCIGPDCNARVAYEGSMCGECRCEDDCAPD